MGVYDCLPYGIQVKCWERLMKTYNFDDDVPAINNLVTYSIKLEEGGYANVSYCCFNSITGEPEHDVIFNKWGVTVNH